MTELKPCPFCDCEGDYIVITGKFIKQTGCDNCGALGPIGKDKERAIELWNERAKNPPKRVSCASGEAECLK